MKVDLEIKIRLTLSKITGIVVSVFSLYMVYLTQDAAMFTGLGLGTALFSVKVVKEGHY